MEIQKRKVQKIFGSVTKKNKYMNLFFLLKTLMEMFHIVLGTGVRIKIHRSYLQASQSCKLFNHTVFHKLKVNNRLKVSMLPIRYGSGFMRIRLNGLAYFLWEKVN
ncbi:hypothetical protein [Oceanobacillus senegalensis]|uniref:hypothetical protein n=1 Tax=Oceanobacillus senegalensis TaxID=1936063 RepID=UPI000A306D40|nr:hypothetical protein [Oceanobacillus senegalensis]